MPSWLPKGTNEVGENILSTSSIHARVGHKQHAIRANKQGNTAEQPCRRGFHARRLRFCSFHPTKRGPFSHNKQQKVHTWKAPGLFCSGFYVMWYIPGNMYLVLSLMMSATHLVRLELVRPHPAPVQKKRNEEPAPAFSCSGLRRVGCCCCCCCCCRRRRRRLRRLFIGDSPSGQGETCTAPCQGGRVEFDDEAKGSGVRR